MEDIKFVKCVKNKQYFTVGDIYKIEDGYIRDDGSFNWSFNCFYEEYFNKVILVCVPKLKYPIIYAILDKLHMKYDKQYKVIQKYKDVVFGDYSNISNKITNIYNNINLLHENKLFQIHSCKIKMIMDSIDTYSKMCNNKMLNDKGLKDIYSILCKYNEFLTTENNYAKNVESKNEEELKNKSGEILNNILEEQNKKLDSWINDLKEFNK